MASLSPSPSIPSSANFSWLLSLLLRSCLTGITSAYPHNCFRVQIRTRLCLTYTHTANARSHCSPTTWMPMEWGFIWTQAGGNQGSAGQAVGLEACRRNVVTVNTRDNLCTRVFFIWVLCWAILQLHLMPITTDPQTDLNPTFIQVLVPDFIHKSNAYHVSYKQMHAYTRHMYMSSL